MSPIDGGADLISVTTHATRPAVDVDAPWLAQDDDAWRGAPAASHSRPGETQRLSRAAHPASPAPAAPRSSAGASGSWSGARPRAPERFAAAATTPLETEPCVFGLPRDLAVRFRTLCAARGVEQTRVLERLVKSYVILGLADRTAEVAS